jgi:hypothetical protein
VQGGNKVGEVYLEEEAAGAAPELEQLVQRVSLTLLRLDLAVLFGVREQRQNVLHQMPVPARSTHASTESFTTGYELPHCKGGTGSTHLYVMRREQVMSTFSLFRNGAAAATEAGSASGAGSLKPKSVRGGRSGAESSGFSAPAASTGASVRFRFFAMARCASRVGSKARRRRRMVKGAWRGGSSRFACGEGKHEHDGEELGFKLLGPLGVELLG